MLEREINTITTSDWARAERIIEKCCANAGLWPTMKGAQKQFPGSTHWHFKKEGARGVLEVTMWPQQRRVWISVHDNRGADWMAETVARIADELTAKL